MVLHHHRTHPSPEVEATGRGGRRSPAGPPRTCRHDRSGINILAGAVCRCLRANTGVSGSAARLRLCSELAKWKVLPLRPPGPRQAEA